MADDISTLLERAAGVPEQQVDMHKLRNRARRSNILRAVAGVSVIVTVAVGSAAIVEGMTRDRNPAPITSSSPSPTPEERDRNRSGVRLKWPEPFVPSVGDSGGRTIMPVLFPNGVLARISYPPALRLAELGAQPAVSYSFDDTRRNTPHDIIFVHGSLPEGLLDPEPLQMPDDDQEDLALHTVIADDLRGHEPYALVFEEADWNIVALLQRREDAGVVASNLDFMIQADGWPSVLATAPLYLAEGFGNARGAEVSFGDGNPLVRIVSDVRGGETGLVEMGPIPACESGGMNLLPQGDLSHGSRCLQVNEGDPGIFVRVWGPEMFVRDVLEGVELDGP